MNGGVVEQVGEPHELYERPATAFVAGFIGTSNLVDAARRRAATAASLVMDIGEGERIVAPPTVGERRPLQITVRPEKIKLAAGDRRRAGVSTSAARSPTSSTSAR